MAYDPYDPSNPNSGLELDPTSTSLFDAFTPELQKGLMSYLRDKQQGSNIWDVAGKGLSAFSKNYMQAIQDPRTRGMAIGAGAAGVGDVLREEMSPEKKLQGTLQTASVLKELAAYRSKTGAGGTSEYERLLAARGGPQYKSDPSYAASVDARLKTFETEGQPKQDPEVLLAIARYNDPKTPPEQKAMIKTWLDGLNNKGKTDVHLNLPQFDEKGNLVVQPGKEEATSLEKLLVEGQDSLGQIQEAQKNFDPTSGTLGGRLRQSGREWKEYFGYTLKPEEEAALMKQQTSKSTVGHFSAILSNKIYGAAQTGPELERAKTWLPVDGEAPSITQTKLGVLEGITSAMNDRLAMARAKGINLGSSSLADLGSIADFIKDARIKKLYTDGPGAGAVPSAGGTATPNPPPGVAAPAGLLPGAPAAAPGGGGGPAGLLPAGPSAGPPPGPPQGVLPAGPAPAAPMGPPVAPPGAPPGPAPAAPGPAPAAPAGPQGGLSVQGGKMIGTPNLQGMTEGPRRAVANSVVQQAMRQNIPPAIIDAWLKENGI